MSLLDSSECIFLPKISESVKSRWTLSNRSVWRSSPRYLVKLLENHQSFFLRHDRWLTCDPWLSQNDTRATLSMSTQADCFEWVFVPHRWSSQAMTICSCKEVLLSQTVLAFSKVLFCIADHLLQVSQPSLFIAIQFPSHFLWSTVPFSYFSEVRFQTQMRPWILEVLPKTYYFEVSKISIIFSFRIELSFTDTLSI